MRDSVYEKFSIIFFIYFGKIISRNLYLTGIIYFCTLLELENYAEILNKIIRNT